MLVGLDPDRLEADPVGVGLAADRDEDLLGLDRAAALELDDHAGAARRAPIRPRRRAARRRRSVRAAPPPLLRRRTAPRGRAGGRPASTSVTLVPSEAQAWESSEPTGPPPSTIMLAGTFSAVVASRLFQARTESRPSIGGIFAPEPVATIDRPRRDQLVVADRDPALADEVGPRRGRGRSPVLRARAAGPSRPRRGSPRRGGRGPPPGRARRRRRPAPRGSASPRPARRRGAAAPSRACRRSRSIRRRSGLSRRSRPSSPLPPAFRPTPRLPARRRGLSRHRSFSLIVGRTITDVSHGGDRLRRGRFVRDGCRSRLSEASLNPDTNQYVRTMSSPLPLSS